MTAMKLERIATKEDVETTKLIAEIRLNLNCRFREAIIQDKGWHKGNIKEALTEAIELYIAHVKRKERRLQQKLEVIE